MARGGGGLHQGARKVGGTHPIGMLPCLLVLLSNPRETSFIRSIYQHVALAAPLERNHGGATVDIPSQRGIN